MALPHNVLCLIREYSKPLTRPDWRTLHHLSNYQLLYCITNDKIPMPLLDTIYINMRSSLWFCMYAYIELWGVTNAGIRYGMPAKELMQINGLIYAAHNYEFMNEQIRSLRD